MSRTRKAALGSAFAYANFALALVTGFVLFPLVIWKLGAYDNGLWLITGELAGYLLLGDLGVFAVLPWLVAARDGAGDRAGIARHLADSLAVGVVVGIGVAAVAAGIWWIDPTALGVNAVDWAKVRWPLTFVLVLIGVGFPFRAFTALLGGLQDVTFVGLVTLCQTALTVVLTATLILMGYGLPGLAIATGVPPLLGGLAALVRVFTRYSDTKAGWYRPHWTGCRLLLREGFGAWLGGLGTRLQTASSGLVFALLGRPEWATVYAATGKVAHVAQSICTALPDSGLVGLSQLRGEGNRNHTRQVVICLLMLYLFVPGLVAIGLIAANRWFVSAWLSAEFYAGDYISGLIALNLLLRVGFGGLFKVVGVAGYRYPVGIMTIIGGLLVVGLGYWLGSMRGLAGIAEAGPIMVLLVLPAGVYLVARVYAIGPKEYFVDSLIPWFWRTLPSLLIAALLAEYLGDANVVAVSAAVAALCLMYVVLQRGLLTEAPWPLSVRLALRRFRLVK